MSDSENTPRSLLQRLHSDAAADDWRQLVNLYTPLIQKWLGQYGVAGADGDDLVQDVFRALVDEIPKFRHNGRAGAFRRWLRLALVNRLRAYWRRQKDRKLVAGEDAERAIVELEDEGSDPNRMWDREHDEFVARRLLELLEPEFTRSTWHAFRRQVLDGAKAAEAAAELGMTPNAALIAKSRVLRRFREEVKGLVDD